MSINESMFRKSDEPKLSKKAEKLMAAAEGTRQITDFFPIRCRQNCGFSYRHFADFHYYC